ncbi:MAG: hypothetical protein Fues2KO_05470 [Fuerstiella sp.]
MNVSFQQTPWWSNPIEVWRVPFRRLQSAIEISLLACVLAASTGCGDSSAADDAGVTLPPPLPELSNHEPVSPAQQTLTESMSAGGEADPNQGA